MKLSELLYCLPDIQQVMLMGDGIANSLKTDADTLNNVLNEETLNMKVTGIEAEDSILKTWVEEDYG